MLSVALLGLVATWAVALGRLAATWRDAAPVPLIEPATPPRRRRDDGLAA